MSSGWHRLPFLSHPDEIANFHFPHHAVALQRFRNMLVNRDFQTWLLIGWRRGASQSKAVVENICWITWISTWHFFSSPSPHFKHMLLTRFEKRKLRANHHNDSLVQDCSNPTANALELLQACAKSSIKACFKCQKCPNHYNDVIMGAMASLKSPDLPLFIQPFIRAQIKENVKAPCRRPLCGEFTSDRWIPRTNGR